MYNPTEKNGSEDLASPLLVFAFRRTARFLEGCMSQPGWKMLTGVALFAPSVALLVFGRSPTDDLLRWVALMFIMFLGAALVAGVYLTSPVGALGDKGVYERRLAWIAKWTDPPSRRTPGQEEDDEVLGA